jgi:hypothetical protein
MSAAPSEATMIDMAVADADVCGDRFENGGVLDLAASDSESPEYPLSWTFILFGPMNVMARLPAAMVGSFAPKQCYRCNTEKQSPARDPPVARALWKTRLL